MGRILVIAGQTATGKSAMAVELCQTLGGEVISADSMQVYKGLDIGTAKPTAAEMGGVAHHLIDVVEPWEGYNVFEWLRSARAVIDGHAGGAPLVVCGGTGLYVKGLVEDLRLESFGDGAVAPPPADGPRMGGGGGLGLGGLDGPMEGTGLGTDGPGLHGRLAAMDPEAAGAIHPNDVRRVRRAIALLLRTGLTRAERNALSKGGGLGLPCEAYLVSPERKDVYSAIDGRVDRMVRAGLFEEVEALRAKGCGKGMQSMRGIGYRESLLYLSGMLTHGEAVGLIKANTRRYAKRQDTWFGRMEGMRRIPPGRDGLRAILGGAR
ncbi:MAG: tRNA (adenosine(37)-N6)-dimethylallyltransferase MiaA [Oscillospiraceae bacterium]|nr:tRNA (adenosine(37)-N6)-dimethylallyltransferase MiaA [Oscillospiraceae bacterium]